MEFEAGIDTGFVKCVEDGQPAAGEFVEGFVN